MRILGKNCKINGVCGREIHTIIYEAMKLRKDCSERGAIIDGESERLTKALKAS